MPDVWLVGPTFSINFNMVAKATKYTATTSQLKNTNIAQVDDKKHIKRY